MASGFASQRNVWIWLFDMWEKNTGFTYLRYIP